MDNNKLIGMGMVVALGGLFILYKSISKTGGIVDSIENDLTDVEGFIGKVSTSFKKVKEVFNDNS